MIKIGFVVDENPLPVLPADRCGAQFTGGERRFRRREAPPQSCLRPGSRGASSIKLGVIRGSLLQSPRRVGINAKQN